MSCSVPYCFLCSAQKKKSDVLMKQRSIPNYLFFSFFSPIRGPPKHKPPPPVKAGSSTEMVSGRRGLGSIFIVAAIIFCTHVQTHTVHLGSHNGANGYWLAIWVGLCVEIISLVFLKSSIRALLLLLLLLLLLSSRTLLHRSITFCCACATLCNGTKTLQFYVD